MRGPLTVLGMAGFQEVQGERRALIDRNLAHLLRRVDGLDDLLAKLRGAGVEVITKPEWDMPGVGRFARIHDPEGNPVELWEPSAG